MVTLRKLIAFHALQPM